MSVDDWGNITLDSKDLKKDWKQEKGEIILPKVWKQFGWNQDLSERDNFILDESFNAAEEHFNKRVKCKTHNYPLVSEDRHLYCPMCRASEFNREISRLEAEKKAILRKLRLFGTDIVFSKYRNRYDELFQEELKKETEKR